MTYVVTLEDFSPSQRNTSPASFWLTAQIQESAPGVNGEPTTWITIDTTSVPTYTDQQAPPVFNYTTELATLLVGWYRVVFIDGAGNQEYTQPVLHDPGSFRPSSSEVAKLVPTRTRGDTMVDQDDFSTNSRPTREQVEALCVDAEAEVNNRLSSYDSPPIPTKHHRKITYAMSLYAAMLVELTRYPEQIGTQRSAYDKLKVLYDEAMTQLEQALGIIPEGSTDGGTGTVVSGYGEPKYAFPEDRGGLVGWDTKF